MFFPEHVVNWIGQKLLGTCSMKIKSMLKKWGYYYSLWSYLLDWGNVNTYKLQTKPSLDTEQGKGPTEETKLGL